MKNGRPWLWVSLMMAVLMLMGCGDARTDRGTFTYAVIYDANGADSGQEPVDDTDYHEGQTVTVLGNTGDLVLSGFSFIGWDTEPEGGSEAFQQGQTFTMGSNDVVLYARWVEASQVTELFVADHTIAKESVLRRIPESALSAARTTLHILYGGTSHSQQVMEGMKGLTQYKNGDDVRFDFTYNGATVPGKLDIHYRGASGSDLSSDSMDGSGHTGYFNGTVAYLDNPDHVDVNVVMWSWCSIAGHDVSIYLANFDELTAMYRAGGSKGRTAGNAVTFVWMTGYASGADGDDPTASHSPYANHKAIVDHCRANGYFCLDYWGQDVYDYGDDTYNPTESGNANVQHFNFQQSHTQGEDWFVCRNWSSGHDVYPAHTHDVPTYAQHITGNRRAYAAWWLWARIAGWDGTLE